MAVLNAESCPFCHLDREIIVEDEHTLAFSDLFQVTAGHSLVIPTTHIESVFELPSPVYLACFNLIRDLYPSPYFTEKVKE